MEEHNDGQNADLQRISKQEVRGVHVEEVAELHDDNQQKHALDELCGPRLTDEVDGLVDNVGDDEDVQ
ncbi:hypothetical protein SDC9_101447 [bioreactor metagenome]|uniref:Uncharacterized protein n=1 Tax=bioreactor metagenome TaxID=1076179 RepID=A0A645APH5_9ZZZZ